MKLFTMDDTYDWSRFLLSRGSDERTYRITNAAGDAVVDFATAGVNGKTPDDTAFGNMLDYSEYRDGRFALTLVETLGGAAVPDSVIGYAEAGIGRDARDANAAPAEVTGPVDLSTFDLVMLLDAVSKQAGDFSMRAHNAREGWFRDTMERNAGVYEELRQRLAAELQDRPAPQFIDDVVDSREAS